MKIYPFDNNNNSIYNLDINNPKQTPYGSEAEGSAITWRNNMSEEKFKKASEDGSNLFKATLPNFKVGLEGGEPGHIYTLGLDVLLTTRELLICPAVAFASTTMGQKGVELAFYRGGIYTGRFWAVSTVTAGYAKWDETLIDFHMQSFSAFGWGLAYRESSSFDFKNPRIVAHLKNSVNVYTTIKILEEIQKEDPSLKVDLNRTFDQYTAGFMTGYFRLILENMGCPQEIIKKVQGKETQCQAQGKEHCILEIGILD